MEGTYTNKSFLTLMQTSKVIQERIKLEMANNQLSVTEFSVLESLYHKGRQTIQQIGNSILISSGSMTYVIDKLEQKGYLKRSACAEDRRAIYINLTENGTELMNKIMPEYYKLVDYLFSSLTGNEAQTLVQLLGKVNEKANI